MSSPYFVADPQEVDQDHPLPHARFSVSVYGPEEISFEFLAATAEEAKSKAKRIADACNSHTRLESEVEALREALTRVQATLFRASVPSGFRPKGPHALSQKEQVKIALDYATNALAQSTPKPAQGTEGK